MRKLTSEQAAAMGRATSKRKLHSAWENGKLGGRPRSLFALHDGTHLRVEKAGSLYAVWHVAPARRVVVTVRASAKEAAALLQQLGDSYRDHGHFAEALSVVRQEGE